MRIEIIGHTSVHRVPRLNICDRSNVGGSVFLEKMQSEYTTSKELPIVGNGGIKVVFD